MTIKHVYKKYKHLDKALCDKYLVCHNFPGNILYDLWQAVRRGKKKEYEGQNEN